MSTKTKKTTKRPAKKSTKRAKARVKAKAKPRTFKANRRAFEPAYRKGKPAGKAAIALLTKIRALKVKAKLTDEKLAKRLNVNRATLYSLARGDFKPSAEFTKRVLKRCK